VCVRVGGISIGEGKLKKKKIKLERPKFKFFLFKETFFLGTTWALGGPDPSKAQDGSAPICMYLCMYIILERDTIVYIKE
jgi:hypothetical protein